MTLCDFFLSLNQVLCWARPYVTSEPLKASDMFCAYSYIVEHVFVLGTVLWYFMMAINIFLILRRTSDLTLKNIRKYQHLFVWGYALSATIPPFITKSYGPMAIADYCYFTSASDLLRLLFFAPLTLCIFSCLGLLVYAFVSLYLTRRVVRSQSFIILRRLGCMVIVFTVLWGLALFARIEDYIGAQEKYNLQLYSLTLSGLCNFMVWGATNLKVIEALRVCCCSHSYRQIQEEHYNLFDPLSKGRQTIIDEEEGINYHDSLVDGPRIVPAESLDPDSDDEEEEVTR